MTAVSALVEELKALRKGRGVLAGKLDERLGPEIRRCCGVRAGDRPSEVRDKVTATLAAAIAELPEDLGGLLLVAYALDPRLRLPFYQERIDRVADQLHRDRRTVRRRIDDGIVHLAELVDGRAPGPPEPGMPDEIGPGWHTEELRTFVNLEPAAPEAFEVRRVVADRDGIGALDLAFTVTSADGGPEIDIFSGGRLAGTRKQATDRVGFELRLPAPLRRGQTHEFVVRFKAGAEMQPHYACVPKQRCDYFDLRVRFPADRLPAAVWRVAGGFQRDLDDPVATGDPVHPDPTGEIRGEFRRLLPGLAYGFRWSRNG
ncbi:hypothetical protein [Amycolatopsis magusensis]|uniref:hypothetical protein n=1 Tax=Amycolatopsis magusensis TaxID=882444 RepID=UPI0024A83A5F|nr:hypothetical protein [Amycolatopsis magusensis]MDI5975368.1 hypothetical protein [Amycolatopsis magusensis]